MKAPSPWWMKDRHQDRRPYLAGRAAIKAALRTWFAAQGFIEVETSCLVSSPGNERHLHAFTTDLVGTDLSRERMYLHTSPEFAMKKLVAAGEEKIFTFAPVFRNRERGALHSPEFTMLEWYRAGELYETLWRDCTEILRVAAEVTGRPKWSYCSGDVCDVTGDFGTVTVDQAFARFAGLALDGTYDANGADRDALARLAAAQGFKFGNGDTWSDIFSRVVVEKIDPQLGMHRPDVLCEYPAHEAALARRIDGRPQVAERFELFVCGVELANGFGELTDPVAQRANLDAEMQERERIYGERYPLDEDFLAAVARMPPCSGCALGFDRLAMLATGAPTIDHVIWTPLPNMP